MLKVRVEIVLDGVFILFVPVGMIGCIGLYDHRDLVISITTRGGAPFVWEWKRISYPIHTLRWMGLGDSLE